MRSEASPVTHDDWDQRLSAAFAAGDAIAARQVVDDVGRRDADRDDLLEELARRAASGSLLATELLAEVVDRRGLARAAVRRVLVDETAIDDVAQDTLIAMAASIGSFRGDAKFVTWLYRLGRNRAVDHLRRMRATEPLDDGDVGEAQRISSLIAGRQAAQQLVRRLPPAYREAVVLRDIERLSYDEAARLLRRNVNTVKTRVARGRALLAAMLEGQERW